MSIEDEALKLPQHQHFYYSPDDFRSVRKPLPLYTADQMREYAQAAIKRELAITKPPTNEEIKQLIIEGATKFEALGDWCLLVEYDPDVGRIPERWEPRYDVFHAASYVVRALYGIKGAV